MDRSRSDEVCHLFGENKACAGKTDDNPVMQRKKERGKNKNDNTELQTRSRTKQKTQRFNLSPLKDADFIQKAEAAVHVQM